jgi:hypothetical protein
MRHASICLIVGVCAGLGGCGRGASSRTTVDSPLVEHRTPDLDGHTIFSAPPLDTPTERRLASGAPGPAYWQQRADYTIDATLDADKRVVSGVEKIVYHNNSPHELRLLWFSLDQNLFREDSDGALISKPNQRFGNRDRIGGRTVLQPKAADKAADKPANVTVQTIGGAPPSPPPAEPAGAAPGTGASSATFVTQTPRSGDRGGFHIEYIRVGDAIATMQEFGTLGRVDLKTPLAAGQSLSIDIAYDFPIPKYGSDRMGIDEVKDGPIFEIAQWFPSLCVYDDVHGWNTLPYLGQGEFYSDFGDYTVSITAPSSHIVAGSGELTNAQDVLSPEMYDRLMKARASSNTVVIRSGEDVTTAKSESSSGGPTKKWVFHAANVRTFAWASSPAFLWDACTALIPERGGTDQVGRGGAPVLCQSLYPREAKKAWGGDNKAGGSSQMLRASIQHYSRMWLAYPYDTATNINGLISGMEYPTIVFCAAREDPKGLWGVTTHEIGHTWFPMVVNTNERLHAWMDEGFNTFMNYYATKERYKDSKDKDDEPHRGGAARWAREQPKRLGQPIMTPADQYAEGTLGTIAYDKTATGLVLLRETILGPERFDAAFREYCRRWAFKHPYPADFFRTMEDVSGMDLGWFWRGWFYGTGVLDQGVTSVLQPDGAEGSGSGKGKSKPTGLAHITFTQRGGLVMPIYYRLTLEDGTKEDRHAPVEAFFNSDQATLVVDTHGKRIKAVEIDPDERMPDVNRSNNAWRR